MSNLAFIGLGVMGGPMAGHLANNKYEVIVFNRTKSKSKLWSLKHNGKIAQSPKEVSANSDIIFTYPINIFKKKSKVQQNYILYELNCVHIFFCEGLVLLKKVRDKLEISYFNKKNKLFSFIDSSVYLGFFKKKNDDFPSIFHYALSLTTDGRPGPVWIDVPIDIQNAKE